jgi:hypothetical protein
MRGDDYLMTFVVGVGTRFSTAPLVSSTKVPSSPTMPEVDGATTLARATRRSLFSDSSAYSGVREDVTARWDSIVLYWAWEH